MNKQIPSIGRIVHYRLSMSDVEQINRRRTTNYSIGERLKKDPSQWPAGVQAHLGNEAREGDIFPMMITKIWGSFPDSAVNGQVFLDGTDVLWTTSVSVGDGPGSFSWPMSTAMTSGA